MDLENEITVDEHYDLLYADIVDKKRKLIVDIRGDIHHLFADPNCK